MSLERALELAAEQPGRAYPKPTVGAVVVRDGEVVGEGVTEPGGPHAEVVALDAAGERARGATLYVTMEPCAHWGTTPPCAERVARGRRRARRRRVARPEPRGGGRARAAARRPASRSELDDRFEARAQNEAWRTWVSQGRPFVTYKVAVTLDGRDDACPGRRWVTGEESRRLVHELRAASDAVAVGMGTVRADAPRLDARDVPTPRGQPRRLAFGRGPLPEGSELELRSGPLADELAALAARGRAVAPARGRADARRGVPRGRPRRQAARVRRAGARGGSGPHALAAGCGRREPLSHLTARARRRGRALRGLCPRALIPAPTTDRHAALAVADAALGNDELRQRIAEIGTDELARQRRAVEELLDELGTRPSCAARDGRARDARGARGRVSRRARTARG